MTGAIERNHDDEEERNHVNAPREPDGDEPHNSVPHDNSTESNGSSTLRIEESDVLRTRRKFSHTSEAQRLSVLEWLEQPPNFQLLAGGRDLQGGQRNKGDSALPPRVPVVNAEGKKLKKTDGFRSLMRHVNARTQSQWTLDVTRSRFESLLAAFRKTRAIAQRSDFHVTANDRVRGITDTRQKLNALCLCYDRLDALFTTGKPLKAPEPAAEARATTTEITDKNANGVGEQGSKAVAGKPNEEQASRDATKKDDKTRGSRFSANTVAIAAAKSAGVSDSNGKRDGDHDGKTDGSADDTQFDRFLEDKDASAAAHHAGSNSDTAVVAVSEVTALSLSPSVKRLKLRHHQSSDTESDPSAKSSAAAGTTVVTSEEENPALVPVAGAPAPAIVPSAVESTTTTTPAAPTMSHEDTVKIKALEVEAQKLTLQQEQLQLQTRELALKEKELVAQESMKKQAVRAELTTKLVVAGKSLSEIKEFLALLD